VAMMVKVARCNGRDSGRGWFYIGEMEGER